jgi:hypothetical protein
VFGRSHVLFFSYFSVFELGLAHFFEGMSLVGGFNHLSLSAEVLLMFRQDWILAGLYSFLPLTWRYSSAITKSPIENQIRLKKSCKVV